MPASDQSNATRLEIFEAITPLLRTMPSKGKVQDRMEGYYLALGGFPRSDIEAGVRKFLSGECVGVKTEFVPPPPQLAQIIREAANIEKQQAEAEAPKPKVYAYNRPNSNVIARNITKDQVREGRGGGLFPPGCIWCPNPYGDDQTWGDLYGPDPSWRGAWPVGEQRPAGQVAFEPDRYLARASLKKMRDFTEPSQTYEPEAELIPPPQIHDYSKEPLEPASPELLRSLEQKQQLEDLKAEEGIDYERL